MENMGNGSPQWAELPADILAAIMNKVPLEEKLGVVPSLCKSWGKAVMDPCSWKIVDLEKFSLEHADDSAMVERMLRFLLNRSSGCLRNLYIARLENDSLFSLVAEMVTLEKLLLPEGRMSDAIVVEHAGRFSNLKFLDLSYCMNVGAQALEALGKNCPLEGLCRCMLPNNLFKDISQDEEVVAIATTMHKLKILRMNYLKFQNESILKVLSSCPDLRELDVRGCWEVNLANHIDEYPSLTVLGPHIEEVMRDFNEFIRARRFGPVVDPYLYTSDSDEYDEDESELEDEEDEDGPGLEDLEF
ncbi:hypothetical protein RJ641_028781 [Dillenia turbinata]|uniref:F-box domain-containing protein n=1 Tax=Dillenia turbinata TaxID=194707 RepID=A0AAN8VS77_9MAGN